AHERSRQGRGRVRGRDGRDERAAAERRAVHARRRDDGLDRHALALGHRAARRRAAVASEAELADGVRVHVSEARLEETPFGLHVVSDGWFVLNLSEALAVRNEEKGGAVFPLEGQEVRFDDFGINVHVIWPGEPNGLYHSESVREAFLVLAGECTLLVEEQERPLRQWDFFHCPAGTHHIFVGAGSGPCAILMIGARPEQETLHYPVSEV